MAWLQLKVHSNAPGFAEEILLTHGAQAVTMTDAADTPVLEPLPGETPLWPDTVTTGLFFENTDLAPAQDALRELLPDGATARFETVLLEDQDWIRVWLTHWHPMKFGKRRRHGATSAASVGAGADSAGALADHLQEPDTDWAPALWVVPHAKLGEVTEKDAVILKLDPGMAFGTGTHPTTALCLEWLSGEDLRGKTVLDYGCGSGILAIAALLLGAKRAICVDIDPQALSATEQNAEANGVADRIQVFLPEAFASFEADYVLANILSGPLVQLAPLLARCTHAGTRLVLAGLLDRQAEEVRQAYLPHFTLDNDTSKDGWTRVSGTA